ETRVELDVLPPDVHPQARPPPMRAVGADRRSAGDPFSARVQVDIAPIDVRVRGAEVEVEVFRGDDVEIEGGRERRERRVADRRAPEINVLAGIHVVDFDAEELVEAALEAQVPSDVLLVLDGVLYRPERDGVIAHGSDVRGPAVNLEV